MKFKSKVFVENVKRKNVLKVVGSIVCLIFLLLILVKILVGDFSASDISNLFIPLLLIFVFCRGGKSQAVYSNAIGEVDFEPQRMLIIYENVDGGKKIGNFKQTTEIDYASIESIEFGQELSCYRIVASCLTKRFFIDYQKEKVLQDKDSVSEVLIYFLDEVEENQFRKMIQAKTNRIVKVLTLDESDS